MATYEKCRKCGTTITVCPSCKNKPGTSILGDRLTCSKCNCARRGRRSCGGRSPSAAHTRRGEWEDAKDAVGDKVDDVKDWTEDKVEDAKEEWHAATN